MSTTQRIGNFEDFREVFFGFRLPRIVLTALEIELFSVMGKQLWTIKALAKTLKVSERGLDILCRNLASAGLLQKQATRYQCGNVAQRFLNRHSQHYRGAYLKLMCRQWEDWSHLTQSVKTGQPVVEKEPETVEYRRAFSWAMHERSRDAARQVARQVNFKQAHSLLDVGGGPGTYALEFLAKNPKLSATVWDRPAALAVAKEIAAPLRQGKRLAYQPGDFLTDSIQGKFDIIWLSNVIHIYSAEMNTRLFRRLRSHLNPEGRIYIQDTFLLDKHGLRPAETNLFAVTMLLFTETGNTFSAVDVQSWLKKTGYTRPGTVRLRKGTGDWDGILIQASR
ncbi:MAG: SAM-dependent methyltransferase [Nitrospirales bacterium]|nr:MAG: SAM-dependent methyltransferase [Nitrospirales bacterium]